MHRDGLTQLEIVIGAIEKAREARPWLPFDPRATSFLHDLSREITADRALRKFPDLIAFGFWCRAANLTSLKTGDPSETLRIGRGVALHIPPANVPLNFAYSLAAGLLSGNSNVVRLSSRESEESDILVELLMRLLSQTANMEISDRICLVRYERSDELTSILSAFADVRVIWGGDETVSRIRKLASGPRSIDISFPDRVSMAVFDSSSVLQLPEDGLTNLCKRFATDTYTFQQNACSSPKLVVWRGTSTDASDAQERFWPAFGDFVHQQGLVESIHVVNRFVEVCEVAASTGLVHGITNLGGPAMRLELPDVLHWQEIASLRYGTFVETRVDSIQELCPLINGKVQTLAYFGVMRQEILELGDELFGRGIDRIVPVGESLNFDLTWDGFDLIAGMTRSIRVR
jgi:hypothetical protein